MVHYLILSSNKALIKICGYKPIGIALTDFHLNVGDKIIYKCPDNHFYDFILSCRTYVIRSISKCFLSDDIIFFNDEVI